ncbi:MAG TPA: aerolysin family beta-barrel pore-forming toxin [Chthonomonadaceae bacterium]|nr:aerolysin family beta-barrel pore-forming toxin [Chthonomonadaceae bacterium]
MTYLSAGLIGLILFGANQPSATAQSKSGKTGTSASGKNASKSKTKIPDNVIKTDHIGSGYGGSGAFDNHTTDDAVKHFSVRWDGDKVRGIKWTYFNGTSQQVGGYGDAGYTLNSYTFKKDETLTSFTIRDSGYGYGSLRSLEFTTSTGGHFAVGPSGFDNQKNLDVQGSVLKGFYGIRNPDNFINCLGLWVSAPAKEVDVSNVRYDKSGVKRSKPTNILLDSGTLDNSRGSNANYMSMTKTLSYTQENDWTSSWGMSASVTVSVEAGVPGIASGSLSVTAEAHQNTGTGGSSTQTVTTSFTTSQNVPAHQKVRVDFFSTQETISVPFTCDLVVKYANGSTRKLTQFQGTYVGSTSTDITATPSDGKSSASKPSNSKARNGKNRNKKQENGS